VSPAQIFTATAKIATARGVEGSKEVMKKYLPPLPTHRSCE